MHLIVNRSKSFSNGSQVKSVAPGPGLQEVPDWVRDTNTFKLGVANETIIEIEVKSPPPTAHVPTRDEVLKAGYAESAVDGIIARAQKEALHPPGLDSRFAPEVPTVDEVIAAGHSPEEAARIVKQQEMAAKLAGAPIATPPVAQPAPPAPPLVPAAPTPAAAPARVPRKPVAAPLRPVAAR